MSVKLIKSFIRDVPDFPQKGILFKDITPLLQNPAAFKASIDEFKQLIIPFKPDYIAAIESRGFIFASVIARDLNIGFVPMRKPGKLPYKKFSRNYSLEYGTNTIEIHQDAFEEKSSVVILDDLLATGGTAKAAAELVEDCKANVSGFVFLIELSFLKGRNLLKEYQVKSIN